jgi:hypothetical protein
MKIYCIVLLNDFLSLKTDVNVPTESDEEEALKKLIFDDF